MNDGKVFGVDFLNNLVKDEPKSYGEAVSSMERKTMILWILLLVVNHYVSNGSFKRN